MQAKKAQMHSRQRKSPWSTPEHVFACHPSRDLIFEMLCDAKFSHKTSQMQLMRKCGSRSNTVPSCTIHLRYYHKERFPEQFVASTIIARRNFEASQEKGVQTVNLVRIHHTKAQRSRAYSLHWRKFISWHWLKSFNENLVRKIVFTVFCIQNISKIL